MLFFFPLQDDYWTKWYLHSRYCFTVCQTSYKRETYSRTKEIQVNSFDFCQLTVVLQIEAHMCLTRFRDISKMEKLSLKTLLFITNVRPCTPYGMSGSSHAILSDHFFLVTNRSTTIKYPSPENLSPIIHHYKIHSFKIVKETLAYTKYKYTHSLNTHLWIYCVCLGYDLL